MNGGVGCHFATVVGDGMNNSWLIKVGLIGSLLKMVCRDWRNSGKATVACKFIDRSFYHGGVLMDKGNANWFRKWPSILEKRGY